MSNIMSDYELLDKAYMSLDKDLLWQAIDRNIDLNMPDKDGIVLWDGIALGFPGIAERSIYENYVESRKVIIEDDIMGFMKIAIGHGLNLNIVQLDDTGSEYSPLARLIDCARCPEFLSFLLKNGADPNLRVDEDHMLIDVLDFSCYHCMLHCYEGRELWLRWAIHYLKANGATSAKDSMYCDKDRDYYHSKMDPVLVWLLKH